MSRLHLLWFVVAAAAGCSSPGADPDARPASSPSPPRPSTATRGDVPPRFDLDHGVVVVVTDKGEQRFKVEVAVKDNERQRGLMYRDHLDDDEGMIFLFDRQQRLSFWMKNTWIPLDMVFIDEDLKVVGIVENAEPLTLSGRGVEAHSRFVLELKGGTSSSLGLQAGQTVRFEGIDATLWQKGNAP